MTAAVPAEMEYFESVPPNFRSGARLRRHQARRHGAILRLLDGMTGNVLDYGCGYGDITHLISKRHTVVGCDVDPRRIAFAASQYPSIRFSRCDRMDAPFADHSFDIVVSSVVLHFVPDAGRHLGEIHRLLRPGGTLLLLCQNQPVLRNAARRLVRRPKAPTPLWIPTMSQTEAMLGEAGFEIFKSTYFYDPPIEGWRNAGDWVFGGVKQLLSALRLGSTADYYGYAARKCLTLDPQIPLPHFDAVVRGSLAPRLQKASKHSAQCGSP